MTTVDLNADVGESFGPWRLGDDEGVLGVVTSVHVACGFHAGDPGVMRQTVEAAVAAGVAVGAHVSYPDLRGFGRRSMDVPPEQVLDDVLYQIGALDGIARACGTAVASVKAHGALYNRMAVDAECARAVARAVKDYGGGLFLVVPAGSTVAEGLGEAGVPTVAEGFCDRAYLPDGTLARRDDEGAVITDPEEAARRAAGLAVEGMVEAVDGSLVHLEVGTLCLHGDTPGAVILAATVRQRLEEAGVTLAPFARP